MDNVYYIIKMLDFEFIADNRWDPIFYLLQELKINQKYLESKRKHDCILHMVDYFVDYNANKPDQNPKFFLIYEDFHSNFSYFSSSTYL